LEDIAAIFGDVVEHPTDFKEGSPVDHVEKEAHEYNEGFVRG